MAVRLRATPSPESLYIPHSSCPDSFFSDFFPAVLSMLTISKTIDDKTFKEADSSDFRANLLDFS
jgi:hypothetical protein